VCSKKDEASSEAEDLGDETDEDCGESEWDELDDPDFAERLTEMAMADDPKDLDWVPSILLGKKSKTYPTCTHKYHCTVLIKD